MTFCTALIFAISLCNFPKSSDILCFLVKVEKYFLLSKAHVRCRFSSQLDSILKANDNEEECQKRLALNNATMMNWDEKIANETAMKWIEVDQKLLETKQRAYFE